MRKLLAFLLIGMVLLTGCGQDKVVTEKKVDQVKTEAKTETEAKVTETTETTEVTELTEQTDAAESEVTSEETEEIYPPEDNVSAEEILIGKNMVFPGFDMTIISYEIAEDEFGEKALIVNYEWKNTGEMAVLPHTTFNFTGSQNDKQTNALANIENFAIDINEEVIEPGGVLNHGQTVVAIEDLDSAFILRLEDSMLGEGPVYESVLNLRAFE